MSQINPWIAYTPAELREALMQGPDGVEAVTNAVIALCGIVGELSRRLEGMEQNRVGAGDVSATDGAE